MQKYGEEERGREAVKRTTKLLLFLWCPDLYLIKGFRQHGPRVRPRHGELILVSYYAT